MASSRSIGNVSGSVVKIFDLAKIILEPVRERGNSEAGQLIAVTAAERYFCAVAENHSVFVLEGWLQFLDPVTKPAMGCRQLPSDGLTPPNG